MASFLVTTDEIMAEVVRQFPDMSPGEIGKVRKVVSEMPAGHFLAITRKKDGTYAASSRLRSAIETEEGWSEGGELPPPDNGRW